MNDFCDSINIGITVAAPDPLVEAPAVRATATRWRASHARIFNTPPPILLFKKARGKGNEKHIVCCVLLTNCLWGHEIIIRC